MRYIGELSSEELINFISLFYEIESSTITTVIITPGLKNINLPSGNQTKTRVYNVELSITVGWFLLEASFKEGFLFRNGWNNKFKKIEE